MDNAHGRNRLNKKTLLVLIHTLSIIHSIDEEMVGAMVRRVDRIGLLLQRVMMGWGVATQGWEERLHTSISFPRGCKRGRKKFFRGLEC